MAWDAKLPAPEEVQPPAAWAEEAAWVQAKYGGRDIHGDQLPQGALARIGSVRLRQSAASRLAFLPDGKTFVAGPQNGYGTIRVWDFSTGKELRRLRGYPKGVALLAYSPVSQLVAFSNFNDDIVRLWNVRSGQEVPLNEPLEYRLIRRSGHRMFVVAPCPDGKLVALQQDNPGRFCLREIDTGKVRVEGTLDNPDAVVTEVAWSPDGSSVALDCSDKAEESQYLIRIWDPKAGRLVRTLRGLRGSVERMMYSPDGRILAASYRDPGKGYVCWVHIWDVSTGNELHKFKDENLMAFSPNSRILATAAEGELLTLRELSTGKKVQHKVDGPYHWLFIFYGAVFSPDGKTLVLGGSTRIQRWDVERGQEIPLDSEKRDYIAVAALSPNGQLLAYATWNGAIRVCDASTGRLLRTLSQPELPPPLSPLTMDRRSVGFTPDGRTLISAGYRGPPNLTSSESSIRAWDVSTGQLVRQFTRPGLPPFQSSCFLVPEQKELILQHWPGTFRFYDWQNGTQTRSFKVGRTVRHSLASDGRTLAVVNTALKTDALQLWDHSTGRRVRNFKGLAQAEEHLGEVAVAPDGRRLAASVSTGDPYRRALNQWDAQTGELLWEAQRLDGSIEENILAQHIAYAPDGRILATADWDGLIRLWDASTGQEVYQIDEHDRDTAESGVSVVAFCADGSRLVSYDRKGNALVWDLRRLLPDQGALAPQQLSALWGDLASDRAAVAFRARLRLAAHPERSLELLRAKLQPVPRPDGANLRRLLADLNGDQFAVRKKATDGLAKLGEAAEPALKQILEGSPPLEVRMRVQQLLNRLQVGSVRLRAARALAVLEDINSAASRRHLQALAEGLPGARLTEEARIIMERVKGQVRVIGK